MKKAAILILVASPAFAELSEPQQVAADRLQPALFEQLNDKEGAAALANCIVSDASNRQLKTMGGDDDAKAFAVATDIMSDPATMSCMADALAK